MDIKRTFKQVFETVENHTIWRRLKSIAESSGRRLQHLVATASSRFKHPNREQDAGQTLNHLTDDSAQTLKRLTQDTSSRLKRLTEKQDAGQIIDSLSASVKTTGRALKQAFDALDFQRAFKLAYEEPEGMSRLVVGGLIFLTPVAGQLSAIGYMLETARNVASDHPHPLPDWKNFAARVTSGLHGLAIMLAYTVPLALATWLLWAFLGGTGLLWGFVVLLLVLTGVAALVLMLVSLARYVQGSSLKTALQVSESWQMVRAAPHPWLVLALWAIVCTLVAGVGAIGCIFGFIFTFVYAQTVFGHLLGQTIAARQRATTNTTRLLTSA
jgi:hypothetical protein